MMFGGRGDLVDCKPVLGQAVLRLNRERNAKEEAGKRIRTEIAQHLKAGTEAKAFIMVQQMLVGQRLVEAYNMLIFFCTLILDRLEQLQTSRECPSDLKQAVASLIYAAPCCTDKEQLLQARKMLAKKFHAIAATANSLAPNCEVNPTIRDGFQGSLPTQAQQVRMLGEIAKECNISWTNQIPESQAQVFAPDTSPPAGEYSRGLKRSPKPQVVIRDAPSPSSPAPGRAERHSTSPPTPNGDSRGWDGQPSNDNKQSSRAASLGEGGSERQAYPTTPSRQEESPGVSLRSIGSGSGGSMDREGLSGSNGHDRRSSRGERESSMEAPRQLNSFMEAASLSSMVEWMDADRPVYFPDHDADDHGGVPNYFTSQTLFRAEEESATHRVGPIGEGKGSPVAPPPKAKVQDYPHAVGGAYKADSIRNASTGEDRKVQRRIRPEPRPRVEGGEKTSMMKQQELKSKMSQDLLEIGQTLKAAKWSGEKSRNQESQGYDDSSTETHQQGSQPLYRSQGSSEQVPNVARDRPVGHTESSGEADAWSGNHESTCSIGGGGTGPGRSRDWDGSRGRESWGNRFTEREGVQRTSSVEKEEINGRDHETVSQRHGQRGNGNGGYASPEQGRGRVKSWSEAIDYESVVNEKLEERGLDRMARDVEGSDKGCLPGFEDLEDFFMAQKKRALQARRRERI